MAEEGNRHGLHVAMFPWLAFGHLIPFLELSKNLAQRGHRISFLSTSRNIQRLPKLPPDLFPFIDFVNLTLPRQNDGNLPENAEATIDVPYDKVQYLKKAFDGLESPLARFLESSAPDWIIYDFAPHWLPSIASKLGIPCAYFSIFKASTIAFSGPPSLSINGEDRRTEPEHFTVPPEWIPFPSNQAFRFHEIKRIFDSFNQNESGVSDSFRWGMAAQGCNAVIVRSCMELESEWFRLLQEDLCRKPVIPAGLLPPLPQVSGNDDEDDDKWVPIREWLDEQDEGSVVYVALGSEATPSQEELTELAFGLELSELPFFWVLRKPPGSTTDDSFLLPHGFEERTKGRGVVRKDWAPQVRILAHPSVGGFLTHSGWSSVVEGMAFGRALVLLPYTADQGLNARILKEKEIGLEIPRDEQTGWFTRDSVAESMRLVMVEEASVTHRTKAKEIMKEIFGDKKRHDQYVDDLVQYLQNHTRHDTYIK